MKLRRSLISCACLVSAACVPVACGGSGDEFTAFNDGEGGAGGALEGGAGSAGTDGGAGSGGAGGAAGSDGGAGSGGAAGSAGSDGGAGSGGAAGSAGTDGGAGSGGSGGAGGAAGTDGGDASTCADADADGVTTCAGDCNDTNPNIHPGAPEICGNAADDNCDGQIDESCSALGTWVSGSAGDDANPGTQASPVKTIAQGMKNAATIGGPIVVYVAGGHYPEKVTLVEGVSLWGGYDCSALPCSWKRDAKSTVGPYDTAILDQDGAGVVANDSITRATAIDGFRIMGWKGSSSTSPGIAAVSLVGGSPTITSCRIFGGNLTGASQWYAGQSAGIAVLGSTNDPKGPLIDGNDITLGQSVQAASGILMDAVQPNPTPGSTTYAEITNNVIHDGSAKSPAGITAWNSGAGTVVRNNRIQAGTSNQTTGTSWGIQVGGTMLIDANHINAAQTTVGNCTNTQGWCGGIRSESSTTTITNNVIYGANAPWSAGVFLMEAEKPAGTVILNGNYVDGGGAAAAGSMTSQSAAVALQIGTCNNCGFNGFVGRIRNSILVGGKALKRFGIYEVATTGKTEHPEALENNDFWFSAAMSSTDALYHRWDGALTTDITTIALLNAVVTPPAANNLNADPKVDATWHLSTSQKSPCIDTGVATEAPKTDFDGDTRPKGAGFDIGPDEAQ